MHMYTHTHVFTNRMPSTNSHPPAHMQTHAYMLLLMHPTASITAHLQLLNAFVIDRTDQSCALPCNC